MPSKRVYVTLIVILIVFCVIMFLAFGVNNIRQENLSSTLIVGDNTTWSLSKKKWIYLRNNSTMEKYNWVKFHVFEDNKKLGDYLLWHGDLSFKASPFNQLDEKKTISKMIFEFLSAVKKM